MDETKKYPPKIQKLFAPQLPLLYKKPVDYPPEKRATRTISTCRNLRAKIEEYKSHYGHTNKPNARGAPSKKESHDESYQRQLLEWEDTDSFAENSFLKDPHRTVFIARLYYQLTELDISKSFSSYGSIESVRIIRDKKSGASRGYGFVVFENEADAKSCVRELASTGLTIEPPSNSTKKRIILVDMERGRLIRNWRPRRLGGGLGGRHYTLPSALHSRNASAAASGRRLNISQNPYQSSSRGTKRPPPDRYTSPHVNKKPATDYSHYSNRTSSSYQSSPHAPATKPVSAISSARSAETAMKDRYAKYQINSASANSTNSSRSIRSIRQRD